jgi:hypothetical protein
MAKQSKPKRSTIAKRILSIYKKRDKAHKVLLWCDEEIDEILRLLDDIKLNK